MYRWSPGQEVLRRVQWRCGGSRGFPRCANTSMTRTSEANSRERSPLAVDPHFPAQHPPPTPRTLLRPQLCPCDATGQQGRRGETESTTPVAWINYMPGYTDRANEFVLQPRGDHIWRCGDDTMIQPRTVLVTQAWRRRRATHRLFQAHVHYLSKTTTGGKRGRD